MIKRIALSVVGFSILGSLISFVPTASNDFEIKPVKSAFKTEGPCMSRLLDKSPKFFVRQGCRLS